MKAGAVVATFIAVGLIAYQEQPSFFNGVQTNKESKLPSSLQVQSELLKYSQFATVTAVNSSPNSIEIQIPVDSLFIANSTSMKPEAERQFSSVISYLNSLESNSHYEVSLLGYPDSGFNPKFRSTRARRAADLIKKTGVAENRIEKVWQVLLEVPTGREVASQAGLSASSDSLKTQYLSIRLLVGR